MKGPIYLSVDLLCPPHPPRTRTQLRAHPGTAPTEPSPPLRILGPRARGLSPTLWPSGRRRALHPCQLLPPVLPHVSLSLPTRDRAPCLRSCAPPGCSEGGQAGDRVPPSLLAAVPPVPQIARTPCLPLSQGPQCPLGHTGYQAPQREHGPPRTPLLNHGRTLCKPVGAQRATALLSRPGSLRGWVRASAHCPQSPPQPPQPPSPSWPPSALHALLTLTRPPLSSPHSSPTPWPLARD